MSCHVHLYTAVEIKFEDLRNNVIENLKSLNDLVGIERERNGGFSLNEYFSYSDYEIIDNVIVECVKDVFLFRTYNYNDGPLYSFEQTLEHIDKYHKYQNSIFWKIKIFLYKRKLMLNILFHKIFRNETLVYTNSTYLYYNITFNENYENTIEKVKDFWNKYPDAVICFG